jgi:hypothetical protein
LVDVSSLGVIARDEWGAALFFVHSQHRAANGIPVEPRPAFHFLTMKSRASFVTPVRVGMIQPGFDIKLSKDVNEAEPN